MSERDRQADRDWLYGQGNDPRQQSSRSSSQSASRPNGARPRVVTPGYDVASPDQERAVRAERPRVSPKTSISSAPAARPGQASSRTPRPKPQPRPERPNPRAVRVRAPKRIRPLRMILLALLAWVVFLVFTPVHALSTMSVRDTTRAASGSNQPGTLTLLVGTDSRAELTPEQQETLGTGDAEGNRADTIMLLYRPPSGRSVLISLPRDSAVYIEGYGEDKLTNAYSYGGAGLLLSTIEQATGLVIDGYLEIGFGGFASLVDAVGGVEVCLDAPMSDSYAQIDLPAGCQILNGANALGYVRMRYNDPLGDLGRAQRQRQVVGLLMDKIMSPASVINPVRYWQITHAGASMVARGDDTSLGTIFFSGLALGNASSGDGLSFMVPVASADGWTDQGASVVIWDTARSEALFAAIAAGDTSGMDQYVDG